MFKNSKWLLGIGIVVSVALHAGNGVEDIKRIIVSTNTRTFSKENLFKYPKYKDTINKLKALEKSRALTKDEQDELTRAQRDKREADGDVAAWNSALKNTQKFIEKKSGDPKSDTYGAYTKAMKDIRVASDKLVNVITVTATTLFGGAPDTMFGSKKELDDKKWQCIYIKNDLAGIIKTIEAVSLLPQSDKYYQDIKNCKDILILTAKYLQASAQKTINDMEKEAKKRTIIAKP